MAMNPMQKKARTSFLLGMFLTLIIASIIIGFLILQISKMKEEQNAIVYYSVYVLSTDVKSGDSLQGKLVKQDVRAEHVPNNAIRDENYATYMTEHATSKIELRKGTVATTDMINTEGKQLTSDVRMQEYNMLVLPSQLEEGEHIDVRLRMPTGEDYIVLSKKLVEQTNSSTVWMKVSEEEMLIMSNAIVEAYMIDGSLLYATIYADAGMQGGASKTYIPSDNVRNLMQNNANIVPEAYAGLQEIYGKGIAGHRGIISSAIQGNQEKAIPNVQTKTKEESEKMQSARQQYVDGLSTY